MECGVEGARPGSGADKTWGRVVGKDCQARRLNREDAMDHGGWRRRVRDD